jgi:hypothetical protein
MKVGFELEEGKTIFEGISAIVGKLIPKYGDCSGLYDALINEEGSCIARMKLGGAIIQLLSPEGMEWYQALHGSGPEDIEHGFLLGTSLNLPTVAIDSDGKGKLFEKKARNGTDARFRSLHLPKYAQTVTAENPIRILRRWTFQLTPVSNIDYPQFATDKVASAGLDLGVLRKSS